MPEALPRPDSDARDPVSPADRTQLADAAIGHPSISPQSGGLWSAERRPLTVGLVLTITLVAAEALAVSTAMPIVAADLGGLELYGLAFSAFLVGSLVGIVVAGSLIDRRGVVAPFLLGLALFAIG